MKPQRCKGMRDLLPAEMAAFRIIENICRQRFLKWGYQEVRTPTIEYLHLFTSAGTLTPAMLGKVYSFLDWDGWSGERVVLRPDGTIPVARLYTENMENDGLARLFYTANIFRFEETGESPRERWQSGAELIGSGSKAADLELIALAMEILAKLGVPNVELRLSHAGIIKILLEKLELGAGKLGESLNEINRENPAYEKILKPLLDLKGKTPDFLKSQRAWLIKDMPDMAPYLDDFQWTVEMLDTLGYRYQIDIVSGAGFEYYTGMIFQLYAGDERIGGGGRYDALIPAMGGGNVPACGFALYCDRLLKLVKPDLLTLPETPRVLVRAPLGKNESLKAACELAGSLREVGFIVEIDLGESTIQKYRWVIEVKEKGALEVRDSTSSKKYDFTKTADLIKLLEGNRGD
jgi:histidyl-tRNA synthetase